MGGVVWGPGLHAAVGRKVQKCALWSWDLGLCDKIRSEERQAGGWGRFAFIRRNEVTRKCHQSCTWLFFSFQSLLFWLLTLSESLNLCTFWHADWPDPCLLDFDMGMQCKEYQIVWFFDYKNKICSQGWYGGCGGNANRFEAEAECISKCLKPRKYHLGIDPFVVYHTVE